MKHVNPKIDSKLVFSKNLTTTNEHEYPEFKNECKALKNYHTSYCTAFEYDTLESNGFICTGKRDCQRKLLYKCKYCNVHIAIGDELPNHKENCAGKKCNIVNTVCADMHSDICKT